MSEQRHYQHIRLSEQKGVVRLTLHRPDKLNSFTTQMHQEIRHALSRVQTSDTARCLVITGAGRAFCSGQDLAELDRDQVGKTLAEQYNPLIRTLTTLSVPVIASVNGVAAGAGVNLALAADIVIAGSSARFIQSFGHIGLVPGAGGTWTLPRLVGLPRAMALALTGEPVSASQAERWGMIWKHVPDADLAAETERLARQLITRSTTSLAYTKQLLRLGLSRTLDEQLELEKQYQQAASSTPEFHRGIDAFLARSRSRD